MEPHIEDADALTMAYPEFSLSLMLYYLNPRSNKTEVLILFSIANKIFSHTRCFHLSQHQPGQKVLITIKKIGDGKCVKDKIKNSSKGLIVHAITTQQVFPSNYNRLYKNWKIRRTQVLISVANFQIHDRDLPLRIVKIVQSSCVPINFKPLVQQE